MFESGDNDRITGRVDEISRHQIRRELWSNGNPLNACVALVSAQRIMFPKVESNFWHFP
jgi:hypothetical protein